MPVGRVPVRPRPTRPREPRARPDLSKGQVLTADGQEGHEHGSTDGSGGGDTGTRR